MILLFVKGDANHQFHGNTAPAEVSSIEILKMLTKLSSKVDSLMPSIDVIKSHNKSVSKILLPDTMNNQRIEPERLNRAAKAILDGIRNKQTWTSSNGVDDPQVRSILKNSARLVDFVDRNCPSLKLMRLRKFNCFFK
jgi:hypothetical protein